MRARRLNPGRTRIHRRIGGATAVAAVAFCASTSLALGATQNDSTSFSVVAGTLSFSSAPAMPTLSGVTLNGQAQTTNTTMTNFTVQDATGSGSGWNVTVNGRSGSGLSAVFAQYCPGGACGTAGYVSSGYTLPANSLTLTSTSASFSAQNSSTGTAPTLQCGSSCNVDSASAVKIASAATNSGMGTWATTAWTSTSLALATATTLKVLPSNDVYRVDLLWTLGSGP